MIDKINKLKKLKQLRDQAVKLRKVLAQEEIKVEKDGVVVVITADQKVKNIVVNGEGNKALVDNLNKALKKSQKVAAKKMQSMGGLSNLGL